jgi:FkbM family methyltransferase
MNPSFKNLVKKNKFLLTLLYPLLWIRRKNAILKERRKSNFLKEIASHIKGGSLVLEAKDYKGTFEIDFRSDLLQRLLIYGDYEKEIVQLIEKYIDPKKDVLDVGANIGLHTVLFSKLINSDKKVLAFEPTPNALKYLRNNLQINNCDDKVIIYNGIATDSKGQFELNIIEGMEEYSAVGQINHPNVLGMKFNTIKVQGNTIDELVKEHNLRPGFIKIDTEGAEHFVFEGAKETINKYKPVIISELSDNLLKAQGFNCERIFENLKRIGYKIYDANSFKPASNKFEGNFIAIYGLLVESNK